MMQLLSQRSVLPLLLLTMWLGAEPAACQFPVACMKNASQPSAVCCPAPVGSSTPCGGPERGVCVAMTTAAVDDDPPSEELREDDRLAWPLRFFAFGCQCRPAYWGADCGEAASLRPRLRKNALSLSADEQLLLRRVLVASKSQPSGWAVLNISGSANGDPATPDKLSFANVSVYDFLVYLHLYASRSTLLEPVMTAADGSDAGATDGEGSCPRWRHQLDFAHRGPAFLPWHRHYLLLAESLFAMVARQRFGAQEFALPYWDWAGKTVCDVCTADLVGPVGNATADDSDPDSGLVGGNFADFRAFCPRRSGPGPCHTCDPGNARDVSSEPLWRSYNAELAQDGLPSLTETAYLLVNASRYDSPPFNQSASSDSFRNLLEGFVNSSGDFSDRRPFMHNLVHSYMRGTWLDVALSPNDPLFWLHHCFVDKLFEVWLRSGPEATNPDQQLPVSGVPVGHSRRSNLVPFFPPVTTADRFARSDALGYAYDSLRLETGLDALALRGVLAVAGTDILTRADASALSGWNFRLLSMVEFLALAACICVIAGWACFSLRRRRRRDLPYRQVDGPIGGGAGDFKGDAARDSAAAIKPKSAMSADEEQEEETPLIADRRAGRRQVPIYV